MHGYINIDKPQGMTSYDVIRALKRFFPRKYKIGHLGTLDPMATGVLPIALGQANKLIHYIEDQNKEYLATMQLGAVSDTQDVWGSVQKSGNTIFRIQDLDEIISSIKGSIQQIPPMYSAVHHGGKRLYELARQGMVVERQAREVIIHELERLQVDESAPLPVITLRVLCSKGTYVRTLCHDIGEKLGTGGVLSQLRRTRSGPFVVENATRLDLIMNGQQDLREVLLPLDFPLKDLEPIILSEEDETLWKSGRPVSFSSGRAGNFKVYGPEGIFWGMVLIKDSAEDPIHSIRFIN